MTDVPNPIADKAAYIKAQKQRNMYIGGALLIFVVLVFFISMSRMAQGLKHDKAQHDAYRASVAASVDASK